MQHPPHWLTSRRIDQLTGEHWTEFNALREEFMEAFETEERILEKGGALTRTQITRQGWDRRSFFYHWALHDTIGLDTLFQQHIQSKYTGSNCTSSELDQLISQFWPVDATDFVASKMKDLDGYNKNLREVFDAKAKDSSIQTIAKGEQRHYVIYETL